MNGILSPNRLALATLCVLALIAGCAAPPIAPEPAADSLSADATAIVFVHSKTENTAKMGQEIAGAMNADYIRLIAVRGAGGAARVEPVAADLAQYRLVFIGSPIWWGKQTPYIDAFVDSVDLSDKFVVLFNTMGGSANIGFSESWIGHVTAKGATVIDHLTVARLGKSDEQVEAEIRRQIDARSGAWKRFRELGEAKSPPISSTPAP